MNGGTNEKDVERLLIEVSEKVHLQVRARALGYKNLKSYLLRCIELRGPSIRRGGAPFPATRNRKRLVADLPTEIMRDIRERAEKAGITVREFVLRCLEADGMVVE